MSKSTINAKRKHNDNKNGSTFIESVVPEADQVAVEVGTVANSFNGSVIFIEPFYGGSHKQLIETLLKVVPDSHLSSLPAKKWPWHARCGALSMSMLVPQVEECKTLFCSSVLSLAELLGLRPDLHGCRKIVYFHENQLVYPIREIKGRDVQFAYNQITTSLSADLTLFNSKYNMDSFLDNVKKVLKLIPTKLNNDAIRTKIKEKSSVVYFPLSFPSQTEINLLNVNKSSAVLHIVWPHRWEFDKGPHEFFDVLFRLKIENCPFNVSILGESFEDVPDVFEEAKHKLKDEIVQFGYCTTKNDYYKILCEAHVVVSTAKHEFFGVSVLESTYLGCYPLVPNRLVYPELYPKECIYNTDNQLFNLLKTFSRNVQMVIDLRNKLNIDFDRFSSETLLPKYISLLNLNK